jgi:tetratricopeptide (TPR) repeat protein
MKNRSRLVCLLPVILIFVLTGAAQENPCALPAGASAFAPYEGRFKMPDGSVLIVREIDGELTLRPIFWRSMQPLIRKSGDEFGIAERADRKVGFVRDGGGCVNAISVTGFGADGTFPRLGPEKTPIESLLDGQPEIAARQMARANPDGGKEFARIGETLLGRFPSQTPIALRFLNALAKRYPEEAAVHSALGYAYIAIGSRARALESFKTANNLDPADQDTILAMRRLKLLTASPGEIAAGWKLPFPLDEVFAKPTATEIRSAAADWAKRDIAPRNVREVVQETINLGHTTAKVRIISHTVRGSRHYGAIIIPEGAEIGKHPVILDLKGVSWDFFPLNLEEIISPKYLGPDQGKFIYVIPSFRGEVIKFKGAEYRSEGDRTDSWDGATDDALALLNVALKTTPQADPSRICAVGKSRGGSVALLAGIRDKRISRVLDLAGPADWFSLMDSGGWKQEEIIREALLKKAQPRDEGGQFIERFLLKAIEGKWKLADVRRKMIQDSPLYFASRLPKLQAHYGIEDEIVPLINGKALEARTKGEFFYHENAGHDLNQKIAAREAKRFLMEMIRP